MKDAKWVPGMPVNSPYIAYCFYVWKLMDWYNLKRIQFLARVVYPYSKMRQLDSSYWSFWSVITSSISRSSLIQFACITVAALSAPFFPRVILLCLHRQSQPKKPRWPHTTGPKPHQLKTPTPKTQIRPQPQNPEPQTTINEQKMRKNHRE